MVRPHYQRDDEDKVVKDYYDEIASDYDASRFNNSYGRYIDSQEREILRRWLSDLQNQSVLDLACGTGRFLPFATAGLDVSAKMIEVAKTKYPDKTFFQASATDIPIETGTYDAVFSLHLFMHLSQSKIQAIVNESYRIIRPNGVLIFDVPSALRRNLISYQADSWHGGTSFSLEEIRHLASGKWKIEALVGVMFLPIHRVPYKIRPLLLPVDNFLCNSVLKYLASYYLIKFVKI
jgi:ubiquinone/menaquinone biosynthesis C-methylase UbiE